MSRPTSDDAAPPHDEAPWCENPYCHTQAHIDGTHLDEHGRPFRGATPTDPTEWPVDEPAPEPAARPFPLTPIHDQLIAEQTYPELT